MCGQVQRLRCHKQQCLGLQILEALGFEFGEVAQLTDEWEVHFDQMLDWLQWRDEERDPVLQGSSFGWCAQWNRNNYLGKQFEMPDLNGGNQFEVTGLFLISEAPPGPPRACRPQPVLGCSGAPAC